MRHVRLRRIPKYWVFCKLTHSEVLIIISRVPLNDNFIKIARKHMHHSISIHTVFLLNYLNDATNLFIDS